MANFVSSYSQPSHQPAEASTSMAAGVHNRSTYQCYPFLTNEEFAEVCHYLDVKYCQATLGPLRKQWRLNLHTALDTSATTHADLVTFLQITKPFGANDVDDQLASHLSNVALGEPSAPTRRSKRQSARQSAVDSMMMDLEEADKVRGIGRLLVLHFRTLHYSSNMHLLLGGLSIFVKGELSVELRRVRDSSSPNIPSAMPLV